MEAGYDYTLMGGRPRGKGRYLPALFVGVLAAVLLISGMAYYGLAADAQADLVPAQADAAGSVAGAAQPGDGSRASDGSVTHSRYLAPASSGDISRMSLYPSGFTEARYWVNPLGSEH